MTNTLPLVSVVVITFNSEKTIIETLESIKKQTYNNIELIISDDYSKDNTLNKCEEWIKLNSKQFQYINLLKSPKNLGVSINCNRGCELANGEWIKIIAGDDALFPDAISSFIEFSKHYPEARIIHSKLKAYDNFLTDKYARNNEFINYPQCFIENNAHNWKKQHLILAISNTIGAVTVIFKKDLYKEVGKFDENIKQCEDWPMWLKITQSKNPFYFLNKTTSKYRINSNSIFGKCTVNFLFSRFFEMENLVYTRYIKNSFPFYIKAIIRYNYYLRLYLDKYNLNRKSAFNIQLYSILNLPYSIGRKLILDRLKQ